MEDHIELGEKDLKALSSSQRLKIIRSIASKPKTPSDIAAELKKSTPTVIEHLNLLMLNGFVVKLSVNDRKYVFYTLSDKGKALADSSKKITIILPLAVVLMSLAAIILAYNVMVQQIGPVVAGAVSAGGLPQVSQSPLIYTPILSLSIAVLFVGVAMLILYALLNRRLSTTV